MLQIKLDAQWIIVAELVNPNLHKHYAINYTFDIGYLHGVAVSVDCTSYDILFLYKHNRIGVVPLFW